MSTEITPKMLRRMASMLVSHDRRVKNESEKSPPRYESHVDWLTRTVPDIARSGGDSRVHISSVIARSLVSKEGHRVESSVKALSTALQSLTVFALPVDQPIRMACVDGSERSITNILLSKPDGKRLHDVLCAFDDVLEVLEKICLEVPTNKMRLTTLRIQSWLTTPSANGSFASRKMPTKQPTKGQQCQVVLVPGVDSLLQSVQSIGSNKGVSDDTWYECTVRLVDFVRLITQDSQICDQLDAIGDAPRVYQDDDETERTVTQKLEEGMVPVCDIPNDSIAPVALSTIKGLKHALAAIDECGKVSKFCCVGRTTLAPKDRALIALALSIPPEAVEYIKVDSGSESEPEPHPKRVCRANDEAVAA